MLEYVSPMARVDSRTQESQRGRNGLSWFGPIDALRAVADDPYTQKHRKPGVITECTGGRKRFGTRVNSLARRVLAISYIYRMI